MRKDLLEKQRN